MVTSNTRFEMSMSYATARSFSHEGAGLSCRYQSWLCRIFGIGLFKQLSKQTSLVQVGIYGFDHSGSQFADA